MTTAPRPRPARRALAALMAFLIAFGPLTPVAYAATTPLADGPINVSIKAKPNIVFTMDDSTSMNLDFLPDYVVVNSLTNAATTYCRSSTGQTGCGNTGSATMPQYIHAEWGMPTGSLATNPWPTNYGSGSDGKPAVMTSSFNAMFYNPSVTYTAPLKYDGTAYPDMNAASTSNYSQVPADPFLFPAKYVNLRNKVNVGVWCNTNYAGSFTPPSGVTADRNGIAIGGDHCRINGYPYTAGGNGAPAVNGDYNYPYARNTGTTAPANFFATTTRVLFCDPNKMNQTTSTTSDRCVACGNVCPVPLEPRPVGCEPGCTNPAECTVCTMQCPVATVPQDDCGVKSCGAGPTVCKPKGERCVLGATSTSPVTACNTVISRAASPSFGLRYEHDANTVGDVCRRNNFTYADGTAGGWTYPSGAYTRQTGSCGTVTASINRHYYKAAVQWCNTRLATNTNDKWRGYGTGTCQAEKTAVFQYPRFVKAGTDLSATADNYAYGNAAFELVELDYVNGKIIVRNGTPADSITHTLETGDTITRDATSSTPEASELVNYANWFAYYRTRMLAAKSVTSLAFSDLTDKFRVGFHTLSNIPASTFLTLADFTGGAGNQRSQWYGKLVGVTVPMGNDTPLLDGVARIGEWFKSSSGTHPDLSGSTNPINLSCQKNYHIMFTDGYTNQPAKPAVVVGNPDGSVIPAKSDDTMPVSIIDLVPGTAWPNKIKEGATAVEDSLSDYTLHYWMKDLRPPTFDASVAENNVPATENDPAKWQHLNFAALSLGTEGVLSSLNTKKTEDQIAAGSLTWTTPTPTVNRPGVTGVDDLWHAAVTGRSQFVNARDPAELQTGMASILSEIKNLQAARAGVAFSNVNFTAADNFIYRVTIEPGWGGTLTKVLVDPKGGGEVSIGTKYHDVLTAQVTPASAGDEPWYDDRNVITWSPAAKKAVPFRYDDMEAGQRSTLGATADMQKKIIAYLRGDRSNEGSALKNFRVRSQVLGDIVNSSPVVVGDPKGQYSDSTDPGYEAFKTAQTGRKKMVYVGANDGMLHGFDEASGKELWAYVPSFVYDATPDKGLAMLAKKEPFFKHQMFVDSTPVAADVDIGGTWKTVLIGGMGKGGKGYYAIDVTSPASISDEADAAANVMWEFSDAEMGYTYGKPLIAKTYKDGWVAILTSGHNSTGKGKLYFVKLSDGTLLRTLETSVGSSSDPSGLAQVSGFVLSFKNQVLEQIYGGDLLGNVWRFDVSSSDTSAWKVEKFATLTSTDGTTQAVTMAPQIEVDFANGVDRYVMVGTGRLLHEDDLVTYGEQVQTMYVFRDGTALRMNSAGLPHAPRTDADFSKLTDTINGFSALSVKGWYHDLPKGERIISPIAAELNLLGYAGSLPPENECLPGLAANVYVRTFPFGASQLIDGGGTVVSSIYAPEGAVGMEFVNIHSDTPNDPTLKLAITLGSDGKTMYVDLKKSSIIGDHRMSWRLIGQ
ncbi:Type IV pilus biogenesis factor PilY1 [Burkholderiales bacterium]|nr:Type IV pilus biogenesis factor PilY1 [Burkholderiales bacterium]